MLRWLATDDVSRDDAMAAGINYREFYRWLGAFRRAGMTLHKTWDDRRRVYYSIGKSELRELLETKSKKGGQRMKRQSRERRGEHGRNL